MILISIFSIFLLISVSSASEQDVLELGDNDFTSKLAEHETVLVMFYAPW